MSGGNEGRDSVARGILIGIILIVVVQALVFSIEATGAAGMPYDIPVLSIFLFGATQLVYMLPAIFIARAKGKPATAKGLAIVMGLAFLINAACFGLMIAAS